MKMGENAPMKYSWFGTLHLSPLEWFFSKAGIAESFKSGQDVKMLFVLAKQRQAPIIFRMISEIDPHAVASSVGLYLTCLGICH